MSASQPRQQAGNACDECRKKKQRCDRQRPRCTYCVEARAVCHFNEKRAPRRLFNRNALKNIDNRLGSIERRLQPAVTADSTSESQDAMSWVDVEEVPEISSSTLPQNLDNGYLSPFFHDPRPVQQSSPHCINQLHLSDVTKADLTQLYLDRVHPMLPLLSPARLSRSRKDTESLDQYGRCLQYAMWTIATAFSSQFEELRDNLYGETREMVDKLDLVESDLNDYRVEPSQIWILLIFYEFMKTNYSRGWLSAGRLFRHVQMSELYSVDRGMRPCSAGLETDPIIAEEKRRAFWLAYCLDRIVSICETTPLTLGEEVIYTRLPCPESEFQSGIISQQCLLSEAMASREPRRYSNIAECVITATICGRALSHKQTSIVEKAYSSPPIDYVARHNWLEGLLDARLKSLPISTPHDAIAPNPMVAFTTILTHAAVLYLWHIGELLLYKDEDQSLLLPLAERGLDSARELCRLAQNIELHGLFRAHAFIPIPVFFGAYRIRSYLIVEGGSLGDDEKEEMEKLVHICLEVLQKLRTVNNLASHVLRRYQTRPFRPL
ncbi:putative Zn(2)-C6 fungal-type domain-containing protein [Seiridium cardinale]|uniref:Zn(2)-C6 fungal-type domain-containing protein n=1 Tax=Seiridium cardinale TaxID=138064 RepID=A0ABR2XK69_9PEZI